MGVIIESNSVRNRGGVVTARAGNYGELTQLRQHLFIAQDTNRLYYRDKAGQLHLLSGGGGGGETYEVLQYNNDATYVLPLHYRLREVIIIPGADADIQVGTSAGGDEVLSLTTITKADGEIITLSMFALSAIKQLYFQGIPADSYVVFFKTLIELPQP